MRQESRPLDSLGIVSPAGRPSFWKNRSILVTGASGFVGSSLAARLAEQGARVIGFSKEKRPGLDPRISILQGSLEDAQAVDRLFRGRDFQIVYHLAAQAIVGTANQSPIPTFSANIQGTWNLMEACRAKTGLEALVVASSDKAYGVHETLPYREEFALQPRFPYDVSKACEELVARSYFFTFNLPVVVTRFANIYGPGDLNFSRIVPDAIRSVLQGKPPVLRSDGTPERDYLYIDDVVDLYLLLAERIERTRGEVFNAGHNQPIRVLDLIETLLRVAKRPDLRPQITGKGTPHGEIDRQWLNAEKAREILGWEPRVPLEEGLRAAVTWYATYLKNEPG